MNNQFLVLLAVLFLSLSACTSESTFADTIYTNGNFYTLDTLQPHATTVAIKNGRILAVGESTILSTFQDDSTKIIDLNQKFAMPGFIEGHGHFSSLGYSLLNLNFLKAKNWDEIIAQVEEAAKNAKPGEWIEGRGWHQEKWEFSPEDAVHGYPFHADLSAVSPDNPVVLFHASGHSLFANEAAMNAAGITIETPNPSGGEIVRDATGEAIGVFEERAMTGIREAYQAYLNTLSPAAQTARWHKAIELAEVECLQKGITSFQDAGSKFYELKRYQKLAEDGALDLRLWAMLRHPLDTLNERQTQLKDLPVIGVGNHFFTCDAIKSEVDGALGAFGAWLLHPYHDKPNFVGQNTTPLTDVIGIAAIAMEKDMQLCVHAIGDRANREVLNIFEAEFKKHPEKEDLRWRIEHAQHLHPEDIPRFHELEVIASMQGIHCTSDAPFVEKRLGEERSREGAYPWRALLDAGVVVANGTDAPVEDVNPIESLYASITRKRADSGFEFFPEQSMTREEAIYSYTLGNAYAAFEEDLKGSLEVGKVADIVVLSNDLLNCEEAVILATKVEMTIVDGIVKYDASANSKSMFKF